MSCYSFDWLALETELRNARATVRARALELARNAEDRAFVLAQDTLFDGLVAAFKGIVGMVEAGRSGDFIGQVLGCFAVDLLSTAMDSTSDPDAVLSGFIGKLKVGLLSDAGRIAQMTVSQVGTPAGRA